MSNDNSSDNFLCIIFRADTYISKKIEYLTIIFYENFANNLIC